MQAMKKKLSVLSMCLPFLLVSCSDSGQISVNKNPEIIQREVIKNVVDPGPPAATPTPTMAEATPTATTMAAATTSAGTTSTVTKLLREGEAFNIAVGINSGEISLEVGLDRLHALLENENDLNKVEQIAYAASEIGTATGSTPDLPYILGRIIGIVQRGNAVASINDLIVDPPPGTTLPKHADAFLLANLQQKHIDSISELTFFGKMKDRIEKIINKEYERIGVITHPAIPPAALPPGVFPSDYLDIFKETLLYSKDHKFSVRGVATDRPQFINFALDLLKEYTVFFENNFNSSNENELINLLSPLLSISDFSNNPTLINDRERIILRNYFNFLVKTTSAGVFLPPIGQLQIENLIYDISWQIKTIENLSPTTDLTKVKEKMFVLYNTIDTLNFVLDFPIVDNFLPVDSTLGEQDKKVAKLKKVAEILDKRFFEFFAPFFGLLVLKRTDFENVGFRGYRPKHPLTRLYRIRAFFAYLAIHEDYPVRELRGSVAVPRHANDAARDCNLGGLLYDSSVGCGPNPINNLDQLLINDMKNYYNDIRSGITQYKFITFAPETLGPVAMAPAPKYIEAIEHRNIYTQLELRRYILHEDHYRKNHMASRWADGKPESPPPP
ncbi:MAG: hypothetical protein HQK53_14220 [Oligoflexia bacterium]|nr:hypothetical protein [Oligoflexia bacterium]